mmetsp:Transcript_38122/g.88739  ORF Transcript_38122/g.88739 Transcript_38122/m.88739 type:complete len:203 (+) Transcript_38122:27-635(+)
MKNSLFITLCRTRHTCGHVFAMVVLICILSFITLAEGVKTDKRRIFDDFLAHFLRKQETPNPTTFFPPTLSPTFTPTTPQPTDTTPSSRPTNRPSKYPTDFPTTTPTKRPTKKPTNSPTENPSEFPSDIPTDVPSYQPSEFPSHFPSVWPTRGPTYSPSIPPTGTPTKKTNSTSFFSTINLSKPYTNQTSEWISVFIPKSRS